MTQAFEAALYAHLTAHVGLTALVGTRIWPDFIPSQEDKGEFPLVVYSLEYTNAPALGLGIGENRGFLSFECIAASKSDALNVGQQLRAALNGISGTFGSVDVRHCTWMKQQCVGVEESADDLKFLLASEFELMLDSAA